MFICNDCGETFLEPALICDSVPYGEGVVDGPAQACCPYCKGNFETAKECELGGEWIVSELNGVNVCFDCLSDLKKRLHNLILKNFTEPEQTVLNALFEEGVYGEY